MSRELPAWPRPAAERSDAISELPQLRCEPCLGCRLFGGKGFPGIVRFSRKGSEPEPKGNAPGATAAQQGMVGLSLEGARRPMVRRRWQPPCCHTRSLGCT